MEERQEFQRTQNVYKVVGELENQHNAERLKNQHQTALENQQKLAEQQTQKNEEKQRKLEEDRETLY